MFHHWDAVHNQTDLNHLEEGREGVFLLGGDGKEIPIPLDGK